MTELDFTTLWANEPPEAPNKPLEDVRDSNEYIELKKEYQQYIQFNRGIDQQRKEVNHAMVQLLKDSKEGKHKDLLDDSLKIISVLMRDTAFYEQITNNLKE